MDRAADLIEEESWAEIEAEIHTEYYEELRGDAPVLYVTRFTPAQAPEEDLIYFR